MAQWQAKEHSHLGLQRVVHARLAALERAAVSLRQWR